MSKSIVFTVFLACAIVLFLAACYQSDPIPHVFQTPLGAKALSNDAIRQALIDIKSDNKVINASYNGLNQKRVWMISRSEYLTEKNEDQENACAVLKKYGIMDEDTSVWVSYYRNMDQPDWPTSKGRYFCNLRGYTKGYLPKETVNSISDELSNLPSVLEVSYTDNEKWQWRVSIDMNLTNKPSAYSTYQIFKKYGVPEDKTGLIVIDKSYFNSKDIPKDKYIIYGCIHDYQVNKKYLQIYK